MTTVRDVIAFGLKQGRVLGINSTPRPAEASNGLIAFQSMLDTWVADGMFGTLEDIYLESNDTAKEGKRYLLKVGVTLTFPALVSGEGGDYGEEGNTSSRQIFDLALVESVTSTGTMTRKLWDRTAWVSLLALTLDSDAPLAGRGMAGLAACFAKTYCEMFGRELNPNTMRMAMQFEGSLSRKFGSTHSKTAASYF